jgi:hypothetical protein
LNRLRDGKSLQNTLSILRIGVIAGSEINLSRTGSSRRQILWPFSGSWVAAVVIKDFPKEVGKEKWHISLKPGAVSGWINPC